MIVSCAINCETPLYNMEELNELAEEHKCSKSSLDGGWVEY